MKHTYHYHFFRQLKNGSINHHFGVLIRSGLIDSPEEYASAVEFLCKKHRAPAGEVVVSNLSLLSSIPA
jgi:hypothetical protein